MNIYDPKSLGVLVLYYLCYSADFRESRCISSVSSMYYSADVRRSRCISSVLSVHYYADFRRLRCISSVLSVHYCADFGRPRFCISCVLFFRLQKAKGELAVKAEEVARLRQENMDMETRIIELNETHGYVHTSSLKIVCLFTI